MKDIFLFIFYSLFFPLLLLLPANTNFNGKAEGKKAVILKEQFKTVFKPISYPYSEISQRQGEQNTPAEKMKRDFKNTRSIRSRS